MIIELWVVAIVAVTALVFGGLVIRAGLQDRWSALALAATLAAAVFIAPFFVALLALLAGAAILFMPFYGLAWAVKRLMNTRRHV